MDRSVFEKGVADGRKPSGLGRPRYTGGLAPYRYGNLKNALATLLQEPMNNSGEPYCRGKTINDAYGSC
jgi:hypothetical protein